MVCFPWFPIFRMFLTGTLETECRGNAWCVTQSSINLWAEPAHPCQDLAPCDYTLSLDLGALNIPKKEKRGCNLRVSFRISQIIWAFTHKISYTQQAFTHKIFFTQQAFKHSKRLHTEHLRTVLLHMASVYSRRNFYTETLLHTEKLLHTASFYRKSFCTEKLSCT